MSSAAITTPSITIEKLRELDHIDLRAFTVPILIEDYDQEADTPVAVLVPYPTFAAWQEIIARASRFSDELRVQLLAAITAKLQRAENPVRHETEESSK
jgi:hypothetical protein